MKQAGRYLLEEELARGGAGVVYRARDPRDGSRVAVKVLLTVRRQSETAHKRFLREAQALARLNHPHVVRIHEVGTEGDRPYLVMDYVAGESLDKVLDKGGPLSCRRAAELTRQVAEAVSHAHEQGILHRDLKPGNVVLDEDGRARLTDFGLVRELAPSASQTRLSQTGQLLGTPGYWPPEQAKGELASIGPHSDVYGLGGILYASLTGAPPHRAATLIEALAKAERLPPAPRELRREIPQALEAICLRCLQPRPERRYQTAAAVGQALETWLAQGRAAPSPAPWIAGGILTAGVLLAGATLWLRTGSSPGPDAPPVTTPAETQLSTAEVSQLVAEALDLHAAFHGHDAALAVLEQALALAPDDSAALAARGLIRLQVNLPGGQADLARASAQNPSDRLALRVLYWIAVRRREAPRSKALLTTWERLHPDDPQLRLARLSALPSSERTAGLKALAADRPTWALGWIQLAESVPTTGEMLRTLERALRLEPDNPRALLGKAIALAHQGLPDDAEQLFDRAVKLAPRSTIALINRAEFYRQQGRFEEGVTDLRLLVEIFPRDAIAWSGLSELLSELGQLEEALVAGETALRIGSQQRSLYGQQAKLLAKAGRFSEAGGRSPTGLSNATPSTIRRSASAARSCSTAASSPARSATSGTRPRRRSRTTTATP